MTKGRATYRSAEAARGDCTALLRYAPKLLLDEATSALGQRTEDRLKAAIKMLSQDKTTIILAHRLLAVTHADIIYV